MTIELQLFGGFSARADGEPIAGLPAAPARLLAYLAMHRDSRPRRVYLAGQFWPDGSDLRARRRLSHTLWVLQTALAPVAPSLVQADRDTIGLDPDADLWVDAIEFERQIDAFEARLREGTAHLHTDSLSYTVDLYRGDLLSDHYDEWVEPERLRLREKYLLGLQHLVQLQKSNRDYRAALVSARRLVAETPLSEEAHAELMRLYWLSGRADEAIAQHQACERILMDELGVSPSKEIVSFRDRILAQRTPPGAARTTMPSGVDESGLVGRFEARRRLLEVVDAALGGAGAFAMLEGQAGMGKTRLLTDVTEASRWRGACVMWARHQPVADQDPYAGILRALADELTGLRREQVLARLDPDFVPLATQLLPSLAAEGHQRALGDGGWGSEERYRLHEALTQVLLALASVTPIVLVVDDLQWTDDASLEFLRLAAPRIVRSRIAVVLSYRNQEARNREAVWHLLTDLEQRHRVTRVPLTGFSRDEIAALSRTQRSAPISEELIDQLERATGGNPLFVIETLRALSRGADDAAAVIDERLGGQVTVQRVMDILLEEVGASPADVQAVVGALAVWGGAADTSTITRLSGLETTAALDAIRHAIDADFVAEANGRYRLRFEQLAAAARSNLSAADRRALHERAGDLLTQDPRALASELAGHYRSAERWADAAHHEAAAAARAASLHSHPTAAHYYELALKSLENAGEAPSAELLFGFESVLDVLAMREVQGEILEQLRETELGAADHDRLLRRLALFEATSDDVTGAIEHAAEALGYAIGAGLDWTPAAATMARVLVVAGRPALAAAHLEGVADDTGASTLADVKLTLGQAMTDTQDFSTAGGLLTSALELHRSNGNTRGQVEALSAQAVLWSQMGELNTAERSYGEAIALARQIGARYGEGMSLANLAVLAYMRGDAAAALEHIQEATDVFMAIGHRRGEAMVRANSASIHHAILGDDARAEREATAARRYFAEIGDGRHEAQCLDVLAGVRRRKRAHAVSRRLAETALAGVRNTGDRWLEVQMLRTLTRTELDAGNLLEARDAIGSAVKICEDLGLAAEIPALHSLQARVMAEQGDGAAVELARTARSEGGGGELAHLAAWWRHEVFAAFGLPAEALAELEEAHAQLEALVAPFDEEDRERALTRVAEHRAIVEAHATRFPRSEVVTLPSADDDGETVEVHWTVHHPDDLQIDDKKERRQRRLLRIRDEADIAGARARVEDLAAALETSVSTLKRDLQAMRRDGIIV